MSDDPRVRADVGDSLAEAVAASKLAVARQVESRTIATDARPAALRRELLDQFLRELARRGLAVVRR